MTYFSELELEFEFEWLKARELRSGIDLFLEFLTTLVSGHVRLKPEEIRACLCLRARSPVLLITVSIFSMDEEGAEA